MLGMDRRAAKYTWTTALIILLLFVVYLLRKTLFVFILALLFAYLLSPLVNLLDRVLPSRTRTPALALAYVIFLGVAAFVAVQIGSTVASQAKAFQQDLPNRIAQFEAPNPTFPETVNHF